MNVKSKPSILTGALVGLLLTAPAIAIFYLASQLAGLPFIPDDMFNWFGRIEALGGLITAGIDVMVDSIISLNLGETSSTAKSIEQLLALGGFLITGAVAGALLFYILNRQDPYQPSYTPGLILGLVVGLPVMLISSDVNFLATAEPLVRALWIIAVFLAWGAGFSWVYNDLTALPAADSAAPGDTPEISAQRLNRRQFLVRVGGATATVTVIGAGLGALLGRGEASEISVAALPSGDDGGQPSTDGEGNTLPNSDADLTPAPGTRPEYTPLDEHYRIDINLRPPVIDGATWVLPITGLVENPIELTLDDFHNRYEPMDQYITLACISNRLGGDLTSTTRWTGISLQKILDEIRPLENGTHMRITSADSFDEILDLQVAREDERVMLAYAWDGQPLREQHGFPLRIYIPDRYGMKQPKWITGIEVIDQWEEGYWVRRGWSKEAIMNTTSVIDTVAADSAMMNGDGYLIPIGGIAHAGARGISKVEVRIDEGDWVEAQLRQPLSETTWVIWRYDWPFEPGQHRFEVRAYDGTGELQIEEPRSVRPDGATGIHSVSRTITEPQTNPDGPESSAT